MEPQKYIEISLCISPGELPLETISDFLQLNPTNIESKNGNRDAHFKVNKPIEWCYTIKIIPCDSLTLAFNELLRIFNNKKEMLQEIVTKYSSVINIVIITDMINDEIPELLVSSDVIAFLNYIKADLSFDIYSY